MSRKCLRVPEVIDLQFGGLKTLVRNLLVDNRNFANGYYSREVPATRDFIRSALPRWFDGISDRVDQLQRIVGGEVRQADKLHDALDRITAIVASVPEADRVRLGLDRVAEIVREAHQEDVLGEVAAERTPALRA